MKIVKFDARYRKSVDSVLTQMGLELISTPRQIENGTLMYSDPETGTLYSLHESGYIRRYTRAFVWGSGFHYNGKGYAMYQLNPVRTGTVSREYNGRTYEYTQKIRIKLNPIEQIGKLVIAIQNYRNRQIRPTSSI